MIGSMCQLRECHSIRARSFTVTLLLRTTRMRFQLLGRVSDVATSQTNKQTNGSWSPRCGGTRTGALLRTAVDHFSCVVVVLAKDNVVGRQGGGQGAGAPSARCHCLGSHKMPCACACLPPGCVCLPELFVLQH